MNPLAALPIVGGVLGSLGIDAAMAGAAAFQTNTMMASMAYQAYTSGLTVITNTMESAFKSVRDASTGMKEVAKEESSALAHP